MWLAEAGAVKGQPMRWLRKAFKVVSNLFIIAELGRERNYFKFLSRRDESALTFHLLTTQTNLVIFPNVLQ